MLLANEEEDAFDEIIEKRASVSRPEREIYDKRSSFNRQ